jgi:dTDP-4-dehydrorhamnose 3,5-epimerase
VSPFIIRQTPLPGLTIVERAQRGDSRGFFSRFFCAQELQAAGFDGPIAQINHTLTRRRGAVRGLHFQYPPHAEVKFISVLRGEIFDVAVDVRKGSDTFLHWHAEILSAENGRSLLVPRGFAHGFQTLTDDCELIYLHSSAYAPKAEGALQVSDPALNIQWPLPITDISTRDASHSPIPATFAGIEP